MPIPSDFEAYYDSNNRSFWIRDDSARWEKVSYDQLKLTLRDIGGSTKVAKGHNTSEIDHFIAGLIRSKNVHYAGPLAGHRAGLIEQHGNRILVTKGPNMIEPKQGEWKLFRKMLTELLGETPEQLDYFHGWLRCARQCLYSGEAKPGQCLVIAGPPDCGKSFLQNRISALLGGSSAKPYLFMSSGTTFNRELFESEHLMIEDVISSTKIADRRNFGSRIKELTVNEVQTCHGKNRDGVNLNPIWRVTITVNDEPEDLMVLPPMIDSVADKFILLRAKPANFPPETDAFRVALDTELPAYVYWLHHEWEIPEAIKGRRFGVKSYQHPDLLNAINDLAPEHELLLLIEEYCFKNGQTEWSGTATELQEHLHLLCDKRCEHLFKWGQACATYLTRLSKQFPKNFINKRTKHQRYWEIKEVSESSRLEILRSGSVGDTGK